MILQLREKRNLFSHRESGYGTGDGLCGWNCYHSFFPYFEGMSRQAFERDPSARLGKINDQVYEESQRQRALERKIRDSRRSCAATSAARDTATDPQARAALDAQFERQAALLKDRERALDDFCDKTGRTKLVDRAFVPTYNRSVSARAVHASKRDAILKAAQAESGFSGTLRLGSVEHGHKKLTVDMAHIKARGHHISSEEEAKSFIKKARVTVLKTRAGRNWFNYYSDDGAAYLDIDTGEIKTAFASDEYDDKTKRMLEVIKRGILPPTI